MTAQPPYRVLKLTPLPEAQRLALSNFATTPISEPVSVFQVVGRLLDEDIVAREDIPPWDMAFYDGYALSYRDTAAAGTTPVELSLRAAIHPGENSPVTTLAPRETVYLASGAKLPEGTDAVLRVEEARRAGDRVTVTRRMEPGENIVRRGSDISKGQTVFCRGHAVRSQDLGVLLELGYQRLLVRGRVRVALFTVGDEIYERAKRDPRTIPDNYAPILSSLLTSQNVETLILGVVPDRREEVEARLLKASEVSDLVAVIGGCSVGDTDIVPDALASVGSILFHGVKVTPGKVTGLGQVRGKPVFMVPGHIGSALTAYFLFIAPTLSQALYGAANPFLKIKGRLESSLLGRPGLSAFRTMTAALADDGYVFTWKERPLGGSSSYTLLTDSNCFTLLPPGAKREAGDEIEAFLFSPLEEIALNRGTHPASE